MNGTRRVTGRTFMHRRMTPFALLPLLGVVVGFGSSGVVKAAATAEQNRQSAARERRGDTATERRGELRRPPGRRGGSRRGAPRALWERMTDEEQAVVKAFIEERFPRMYVELERLEEHSPERYARRMARIAPEMRRLMEILDTDPERGTLMIQERQQDIMLRFLARRYRSANNAEDEAKIRGRARELAEKLFDVRHQRRALEIRELETRLDELRGRHEQAAQMRDQLIERELKDLLDGPARPPRSHD